MGNVSLHLNTVRGVLAYSMVSTMSGITFMHERKTQSDTHSVTVDHSDGYNALVRIALCTDIQTI